MNNAAIHMLEQVAAALDKLNEQVVFVGGATLTLYVNVPQPDESRVTDDVDFVVEVTSRMAYYEFEQALRSLGFAHDIESNIICRFKLGPITVDAMPMTEDILGFSNPWYPMGILTAQSVVLPSGLGIRILDTAHLLATKLAAAKGRGGEDLRLSKDWDDIVYLTNNRENILPELKQLADVNLRTYISTEVKRIDKNYDLRELVEAVLPPSVSDSTIRRVVALLREYKKL